MSSKRNPHWNGNIPADDDAARRLIIDAAICVAERDGIKETTIKKVADELCITRQTVYRLYSSTDELLTQVSLAVGGHILDRLMKVAFKYDSFEERLIESMVFLAWNIPNDELLKHYFVADLVNAENLFQAFSDDSLNYAHQMLKALYPDTEAPADEAYLRELAEHMLHILLAITIAPSKRIKTAKGLRSYLNKWLKPLLVNNN